MVQMCDNLEGSGQNFIEDALTPPSSCARECQRGGWECADCTVI